MVVLATNFDYDSKIKLIYLINQPKYKLYGCETFAASITNSN